MPRPDAKPLVLPFVAILVEYFCLNWLRLAEVRLADLFVAVRAGTIKPGPDIVLVSAHEQYLAQRADRTGRLAVDC